MVLADLMIVGMAKAGPDCIGEAHGGFASDGSDISGFSHMVSILTSHMFFNTLTFAITARFRNGRRKFNSILISNLRFKCSHLKDNLTRKLPPLPPILPRRRSHQM